MKEDQQPKLYMLIGPPCSGKSTWVENNLPTTPILSTDRYIEQFANLSGKTYSEVFQEIIKQATSKMYSDLEIYVNNDMDIIWDQTNLAPKARQSKLSKVPDHYKKIAICFNITEEEFLKRNQVRAKQGKSISLSVFQNMMSTYVPPSKSEGFDKIINV